MKFNHGIDLPEKVTRHEHLKVYDQRNQLFMTDGKILKKLLLSLKFNLVKYSNKQNSGKMQTRVTG